MIFDKHIWVCSTCGQGLTRKSSAKRHNANIHFGDAMIVRPYEYIVGRLNGKFLPNDPSSYRRSKKNQKNVVDHSYYNHDIDNNTSEFKTVEDSRGHELPDRNIRQQQPIKYNNIKKPLNLEPDAPPIFQPVQTPVADVKSSDNGFKKFSERKFKLEELKILLNKYYPPQNASEILKKVIYLVYQRNDDGFLDERLTFLRNINRGLSGFS